MQYRPIIDNDNIELSEKCCDILKKGPLKKTEREMGHFLPVTGGNGNGQPGQNDGIQNDGLQSV